MPAGRPTKMNLDLARRIAAKVKKGIRMADAAESEGIDRSSLFNYMNNSPEFAAIVNAALSQGKRPKQAG